MRSTTAFFSALFAAASTSAIQITYPTKDETLPLSQGIKVKWTTVSTDPAKAHLFLVNMASGHTPFSKDLGEVDLARGSFVVVEQDIPSDSAYQFNFQSVDENNTGILAQSAQFAVVNIENEGDVATTLITDDTKTSAKTTGKTTATAEDATVATTISTVSASATETGTTESAAETASVTGTAAAATSSSVDSGAEVRTRGSMLALVAAGVVALVL
ncbi:hypothetical protein QBC38DRAFT_183757 [Podospora fimiseda]|uniref:Yeast cell wall synthesis Kre9/Knh1-like N-terminal domain-containing protein n=1 Tax=Podospora fimiseda TaxID=252190 RepID=A0AAN7H345_9PEZI|nr:hypothetical protein QBC38DRAFT_183757 [Podospora fimiseda]